MTTSPLAFGQVAIDCERADTLAGFWAALLDQPVQDGAGPYFAVIAPAPDRGVPALMFLAVPEPRQGKNRLHLDLTAPDIAAAADRAVTLGATRVGEFNEYGTRWTTLADPEGNVFDIGLSRT